MDIPVSTPVARNSNFNRVVNHSVAHEYVIPTRDTLLSIRVKPTMPDPRIHVIKTKKSPCRVVDAWWNRFENTILPFCLLLRQKRGEERCVIVSLGIVEKLSSNSNSFIGYKVQNYRGEEEGVMVYKSVEGFNGKSAPRWSETRL